MTPTSHIEIYQSDDGQTQIEVRLEQETLWVSQAQMAELFEKDVRTINEHLRNIFKEGELDKDATIRKFQIVRQEGARQVKREIEHYNLDAAISVGYRVNSKKGTQFRIWATQRLREFLVNGYTVNQQRFEKNAAELEQALTLIRRAAQSPELGTDEGRLLNAQGEALINDTGLAAITLLVAESDPKQKDTLIRLIMNMLVTD